MRLGNSDQAQASMQAFLSGARAEMVNFPATLEEMRSYWYDVSKYQVAADLENLFDALLAAGLTVDNPSSTGQR